MNHRCRGFEVETHFSSPCFLFHLQPISGIKCVFMIPCPLDVFFPWFLPPKIPWFIPHLVQVWRNFVSYTWHAPIGCSEVVNGPIRHFLSPLTLVDFHFWVDHFQNLMKCVKHPFKLLSHLCTSSFGFLSFPLAHFDHIDQNCFSPDHLGYVLARLSNMSSNTLNKVSRLTP